MAVADVYRVRMTAEGREGEWSITLHYQELTEPSLAPGPDALAEGVAEHLTGVISACLATSHQVSRWRVDKLSGTKAPAAHFSLAQSSRGGTNSPLSLPASVAMRFQIFQLVFDQASNGGFHLSGIPADQVLGNVAIAAYTTGVVAAFAGDLLAEVEEESGGDGLWRLGVLSRKFLLANPGDFAGAFADAVSIGFDARTGTMRSRRFGGRRRTKVVVEE